MNQDQITTSLSRLADGPASVVVAPRLAEWKRKAEEYQQLAQQLGTITEDRQAADAADIAKMAKTLLDEIEDARVAAVTPLNEVVREINGACKGHTEGLDRLIRSMKERVGAWRQKQREAAERARREREEREHQERERLAREEAERRLAEGLDGGAGTEQSAEGLTEPPQPLPPEPEPLPEIPNSTPASFGRMSARMRWHWTLVDFAAVPDELKVLNEKMLNVIRGEKPRPREIPGIAWEQREDLSLR